MPFETAFLGKGLGAHISSKVFDVSVNSWNMFIQTAFLSELFAADVTRVRSFAGPGSSDGGVAVRRVVVSVDRWLVAERHVTDLTLNTWRPYLWNTQKKNEIAIFIHVLRNTVMSLDSERHLRCIFCHWGLTPSGVYSQTMVKPRIHCTRMQLRK